MPEIPDQRSLRERVLQGHALSLGGSSFFNPAGSYAASALAVAAAVRRETAVTQLMALLPQREALDAALAEARRRADVFLSRMIATTAVTDDPYAAGLESVVVDVQKGLL